MTTVTWNGGAHRITDPNAWSPDPPLPGDIGIVASGDATAVGQTLGRGRISLANESAAASPALDLFQATIAESETVTTSIYPEIDNNYGLPPDGAIPLASAYGTIDAVGLNVNAGMIVAGYASGGIDSVGTRVGTAQTLRISDVTSPSGVVIQPGRFVNTGTVMVDADATLTIAGASPYSQFVNNGALSTTGGVTIDAAITGTGSIGAYGNQYAAWGNVTFERSVSAGQTVDLQQSGITLDDPAEFAGLIVGIDNSYVTSSTVTLKGVHETSATFGDGVLTVYDGDATVARLRFGINPNYPQPLLAGSFAIDGEADGVLISYHPFGGGYGVSEGTSAPATATVLPTPVRLPAGSAAPVTLTSGTTTITQAEPDGYALRLEGVSATDAPALAATSTVFGPDLSLAVQGDGSAARYGRLDVVGYNGNEGVIATEAGSAGGSASLALDISDVVSSNGAVVLGGVLNNTGTIDAGAGTTIQITGSASSKLINAGDLNATGSLFVGTAITGTGTMAIGTATGASGSLETQGAVSTGQAIDFNTGRLTIDDARLFYATIYGFDAKDTIVLKGRAVSAVTYVNGALLLDGGADGTLHFRRPAGVTFDTGSFALGHTGAGDTTITFQA